MDQNSSDKCTTAALNTTAPGRQGFRGLCGNSHTPAGQIASDILFIRSLEGQTVKLSIAT